jgi:hypothetical protein
MKVILITILFASAYATTSEEEVVGIQAAEHHFEHDQYEDYEEVHHIPERPQRPSRPSRTTRAPKPVLPTFTKDGFLINYSNVKIICEIINY